MTEESTSSNQNPQTSPTGGQQSSSSGASQGKPVSADGRVEAGPKETIREIHHHHYDRGGRFFPRLFWGLLIIFIGLVFLAQSAGVITGVDVGKFFASIWPIFIILIGLSIMSRGGFISGLISTIILIAILGLVFLYVVGAPIFGGRLHIGQNSVQQIQNQEISVDKLTGAQAVSVNIHAGAGQINVSGGSDKLVTGSLSSNITTLETSGQLAGNIQNVDISLNGNAWNFIGRYTNDLTVDLSSSTPTNLSINAGAASQSLDLTDVQIDNLDIHTGASSVNLTMGDKVDNAMVSIEGGASSVHITLPKTLGAKVTAEGGLTSKNFTDFTKLSNNTYQSNNYDQSAKKVSITLHGGASSYTIDWK